MKNGIVPRNDQHTLPPPLLGIDCTQIAGLFAPLEAILMVIDRPLSLEELAQALDIEPALCHQALEALRAEYLGSGGRFHGFELREAGGGWRIYSSPHFADLVGHFLVGSDQGRLSQAALETLAVVAYRQPVTRSRISQIRGVNVDSVVRTLVARDLIEETGETESGAKLYSTTAEFLERMGFESIDDLVPLAPYLPDANQLDELEQAVEERL